MNKLSITLSPVALDYRIAMNNDYTSHVTPMLHVTRNTLILSERSL